MSAKSESADAARNSISSYDARIEELELQIQKHIAERSDLEIKLEEAVQDSGKILQLVLTCVIPTESFCFREKGYQG